jgi:hypothetical protein
MVKSSNGIGFSKLVEAALAKYPPFRQKRRKSRVGEGTTMLTFLVQFADQSPPSTSSATSPSGPAAR